MIIVRFRKKIQIEVAISFPRRIKLFLPTMKNAIMQIFQARWNFLVNKANQRYMKVSTIILQFAGSVSRHECEIKLNDVSLQDKGLTIFT